MRAPVSVATVDAVEISLRLKGAASAAEGAGAGAGSLLGTSAELHESFDCTRAAGGEACFVGLVSAVTR